MDQEFAGQAERQGEASSSEQAAHGGLVDRTLLIRLGIWVVAIAVISFLPAIGCEFVNMDDDRNFTQNKNLNLPLGQKLYWAWTTHWLGVYQPFAWMLIFAQQAICKLRPMGFHITSIAIHAAVGLSLFLVTRRLIERVRPSRTTEQANAVAIGCALATCLFCAHPLRTETVVWLSAQPYLPSVLFFILGVGAYLTAFSPENSSSRRSRWKIASFVLGAVGMLFKAVTVTFPLVLLVLDLYPLGRLNGEGSSRPRRLARLVIEKLPLLFLSLMIMLAAKQAKNYTKFESGDLVAAPFSARLADTVQGVWFYPGKTFIPTSLTIVYPREDDALVDIRRPLYAIYGVGVVAISGLAFMLRRRLPSLAACWVAYLILLGPNSGIIRFSPQFAADRYSYAASLPWVALAAGGFSLAWQWRPRVRAAAYAFTGLAVVGLGVLSWFQCATWKNSITLWNHALEAGADRSLEAHGNLSIILSQVGFEEEAHQQCLEAVRVAPRSTKAHMYLAESLARQGKKDEALAEMNKAVEVCDEQAAIQHKLGLFLMHLGKSKEAEAPLRKSLELAPRNHEVHRDLATLLAVLGRKAEAREQYEQALALKPDDTLAQTNYKKFLEDSKPAEPPNTNSPPAAEPTKAAPAVSWRSDPLS